MCLFVREQIREISTTFSDVSARLTLPLTGNAVISPGAHRKGWGALTLLVNQHGELTFSCLFVAVVF